MARTEISAALAIQAFARKGISVQQATPVKMKGEDGKERSVFKTEMVALREEHILAASQEETGLVRVTTIDGKRYEAKGEKPKADKKDEK